MGDFVGKIPGVLLMVLTKNLSTGGNPPIRQEKILSLHLRRLIRSRCNRYRLGLIQRNFSEYGRRKSSCYTYNRSKVSLQKALCAAIRQLP